VRLNWKQWLICVAIGIVRLVKLPVFIGWDITTKLCLVLLWVCLVLLTVLVWCFVEHLPFN
jgi:hypothetical protein